MTGLQLVAWTVALLLSLAACSEERNPPAGAGPDWVRGRKVYFGHCVACHNADPAKNGSVGPALSDSSEDLLRARLLHRAYPQAYAAKRATRIMPVFPSLEKEIPYLAIYLRSRATDQAAP